MNEPAGTVFIVGYAQEVGATISRAVINAGYGARVFASAEHFLDAQDSSSPACLLANVCMPGMNGLELQRALIDSPQARPIVFLSAITDIETCVLAMKHGAVNFLTKPIGPEQLLSALDQALHCDAKQRQARSVRNLIRCRLQKLSKRERQVMKQVIEGKRNKQIAVDLGICEQTVKAHRGRVMSKMGARSVVQLVPLATLAGITTEIAAIDRTALRPIAHGPQL